MFLGTGGGMSGVYRCVMGQWTSSHSGPLEMWASHYKLRRCFSEPVEGCPVFTDVSWDSGHHHTVDLSKCGQITINCEDVSRNQWRDVRCLQMCHGTVDIITQWTSRNVGKSL